nr:immunoglobulin heavy chain junction region [Macaca mulatta]MOV40573.1 immunoglobulin heavy chain junction region [Macaca mulatta]MOV41643.1 immunoglobulin heavy chain junction region [Macaca mulatta]MOV41961.1 immunoglobulin heavy chain junction region [Macaca mulatta]MOV42071.1 immunoglobulin heavy chain junction region [Macaca mulatta]
CAKDRAPTYHYAGESFSDGLDSW